MSSRLSRSQLLALEHITSYAKNHRVEAQQTIRHILEMSNLSSRTYDKAIAQLKLHARIALHFHPDRPDPNLISVAEALLEHGVYKSQFETLLSNGSVSAYPGGARDLWEEKLFGGAYQLEEASNSQRPKYGALDLMLHPDGPAPRFGSCYFLLSPHASHRSTFSYLDSHQDPNEKGTYDEFDMIMAALMRDAFIQEYAIGENGLTPRTLVEHLLVQLEKPFSNPEYRKPKRTLNHYIEAQVHGDISLKDDVEILVADPSFKDSHIGNTLELLCTKHSIDLYWHMGFALSTDEVPSDFRGPTMPSLAKRIAQNHYIDANKIGSAVMDLTRNPDSWSDRGTYQDVLQELKLLWHVLVRYGRPLRDVTG